MPQKQNDVAAVMLAEFLDRHLQMEARLLSIEVGNACHLVPSQRMPYCFRLGWDNLPSKIVFAGLGEDSSRAACELPSYKVDAICLQTLYVDSMDPISVFHIARQLLPLHGSFFCLARLGPPRIENSSVAERIESFFSVAQRCGFVLVDKSVNYSPDGGCNVVVLLTRANVVTRWEISRLEEFEISEFLRLFRNVFETDCDPAVWNWKYGDQRGRAIVAKRGHELIAHYGSTMRAISYFGKSATALQICDVMVARKERGVLTKKGAMFLAAAVFLEVYLHLQQHTLAYGFPTRRHMLLGQKLGLYAEVAKMVEVRWPVPRGEHVHRLRVTRLEKVMPERLDRAWAQMQDSLKDAICVIRDWSYLNYRYFEHPQKQYGVYCITTHTIGSMKGVIVLRAEDDECELLDIVSPLENIPALIHEAKALASQWGCSSLYCWITENFAPYFNRDSLSLTDLDISVPTNVWVPGPAPEYLAGKWWLMSGDTEFR